MIERMEIKYHDIPFQNKTDISKEQKEIVDKYLEFSEAVIKHDQVKNNENGAAIALAEGLQFSEPVIKNMEYAFSAPDVATPFVGNWTTGTLNMLIQEVGSSVEKDTLLSLAFPDKPVPEYLVILDRITANSGMLSEFGGDSSTLPTIKPLNTYGLEYEPGLWAGRTSIGSKDIMFNRLRGAGSFNDRGIGQMVAYNSVYVTIQALTRKKYLLSQAIFNNGFTYGGMTVNSNIPSGNYLAMDPMGTLNADGSVTYANSDPLYNPFISITNILGNPIFLKYRERIKGIVVNAQDLQAIMNHPNVKPTTNLLMAASSSVGSKSIKVQIGDLVKELNAYYAPGFEIPMLADGEVWVGQNADGSTNNDDQNFFIPRGSMYILLDLTSQGGQSGAFHLTYNQVDPNIDAPAQGLFTGVFARNLNNADTVNRLDIVAALSGAPAVYMPEAQFILTGLYS